MMMKENLVKFVQWWFRSYRDDRQTNTHTNRHYWKQYHPHCIGSTESFIYWGQKVKSWNIILRGSTMMATNHDGHEQWQWRPQTCFLKMVWPWIWRFLKSSPMVYHVFVAVAVMVCGCHGIGPILMAQAYSTQCLALSSEFLFIVLSFFSRCSNTNFVCEYLSASTVSDFEIKEAEEKFEDSKQLAEAAMLNLLENEVGIYSGDRKVPHLYSLIWFLWFCVLIGWATERAWKWEELVWYQCLLLCGVMTRVFKISTLICCPIVNC